MGSELVNGEYQPELSYTEKFNRVFPYYLHIGMTPAQFWDEDSTLAKSYYQKYLLDIEHRNQEMWWQGAYIYQGVSVALSNFAKKKSQRPLKYLEKPIRITPEREEEKALRIAQERQKTIDFFNRLKKQHESRQKQ